MKYNILDNLCKIESILYEVYDDECSFNECSLNDTELNKIIYLINQIREYMEEYDEEC